MTALQQAKTFLVENLHLAKDALHIYVALIVFFGTCLLFGWKVRDWKPLAAVLAVALLGEAWDLRDQLALDRPTDFPGHVKDLWNTMLAPAMLFVMARFTSVFDKARRR